jgi:Fungal specific transcription factor domain
MEALEKLVRGLVGESALQRFKEGSYDLKIDHDNTSSSDEVAPLQRSTTGESAAEGLDNLNLAMGQLTILPESEGGTLYAGGTAWDSVFAQFAELRQLLKQVRDMGALPDYSVFNNLGGRGIFEESPSYTSYVPSESFYSHHENETAPNNSPVPTSFPFHNSPPPPMSEILAQVPSPKLSAKLIENSFATVLPFNRIVHYQTFMKEYNEFRKAPAEVKPSWLALLFAMLSCSVLNYSPTKLATISDENLSHEQATNKYQQAAAAALVHAHFLQSHNLNVIQAMMFLQMCTYPNDVPGMSSCVAAEIVSSWALHGATKNLALQMGLHREPSLFKIPEPEAEIRRRVWWCLYLQDRYPPTRTR